MIGERAPFARVSVQERKIVDYLLDLGHPDGGSKAHFFLTRGFRSDRPSVLADALLDHVRTHAIASVRYRPQGPLIAVEGSLSCPDGTAPLVRTVWRGTPSNDGEFVTAYAISRRRT